QPFHPRGWPAGAMRLSYVFRKARAFSPKLFGGSGATSFVNLDVSTAERPTFGRTTGDRNRESVVAAGLTIVRHIYRESTWSSIVGACATERGGIAGNH